MGTMHTIQSIGEHPRRVRMMRGDNEEYFCIDFLTDGGGWACDNYPAEDVKRALGLRDAVHPRSTGGTLVDSHITKLRKELEEKDALLDLVRRELSNWDAWAPGKTRERLIAVLKPVRKLPTEPGSIIVAEEIQMQSGDHFRGVLTLGADGLWSGLTGVLGGRKNYHAAIEPEQITKWSPARVSAQPEGK